MHRRLVNICLEILKHLLINCVNFCEKIENMFHFCSIRKVEKTFVALFSAFGQKKSFETTVVFRRFKGTENFKKSDFFSDCFEFKKSLGIF